jgi:hypothetical protein
VSGLVGGPGFGLMIGLAVGLVAAGRAGSETPWVNASTRLSLSRTGLSLGGCRRPRERTRHRPGQRPLARAGIRVRAWGCNGAVARTKGSEIGSDLRGWTSHVAVLGPPRLHHNGAGEQPHRWNRIRDHRCSRSHVRAWSHRAWGLGRCCVREHSGLLIRSGVGSCPGGVAILRRGPGLSCDAPQDSVETDGVPARRTRTGRPTSGRAGVPVSAHRPATPPCPARPLTFLPCQQSCSAPHGQASSACGLGHDAGSHRGRASLAALRVCPAK